MTGRRGATTPTPDPVLLRTPVRCSNVNCPNDGPGSYEIVWLTHGRAVGGHRDVTLVLCSPCALGLQTFEARR